MRVVLTLELRLINADELLPPPRVFAVAVVGDPIKPGGELRLAAETADVLVGFKEGFLGEVIGERHVGAREISEQTTYRGLMPPHQLGKRVMVIIEKNPGDEVCIRQRHAADVRATAAGCLYRCFWWWQRYRSQVC